MEFPDLGKNCSEKSCSMLDFLPMKCDACGSIFCKNHIQYTQHVCEKAYQKDIQVPVCPLCNKPVPSNRGEQPDIAVGDHIDRDCQSDPAIAKRKIYTKRCSVGGCKRKEVIPFTCSNCHNNFCLTHRHYTDHSCNNSSSSKIMVPASDVALSETKDFHKNGSLHSREKIKSLNWRHADVGNLPGSVNATGNSLASFQGGMSEDEALALALSKSMIDSTAQQPVVLRDIQEEEDRLLAEALAASEKESKGVTKVNHDKEKSCILS